MEHYLKYYMRGFDVNSREFLDYTCTKRWFAGSPGAYSSLIIWHNQQVTSIQFCQDTGRMGGFKITLNATLSYTIGCDGENPVWQNSTAFTSNETITGFEIFYNQVVSDFLLHTNEGIHFLASPVDITADSYCFLQQGDLVAIDWANMTMNICYQWTEWIEIMIFY